MHFFILFHWVADVYFKKPWQESRNVHPTVPGRRWEVVAARMHISGSDQAAGRCSWVALGVSRIPRSSQVIKKNTASPLEIVHTFPYISIGSAKRLGSLQSCKAYGETEQGLKILRQTHALQPQNRDGNRHRDQGKPDLNAHTSLEWNKGCVCEAS